MSKREIVWLLVACPHCQTGLRLTIGKHELKKLLQGKRELIKFRVEEIK